MRLKKLFFNKSKSITSAAFLIGLFALASRLLGLIRARVFANKFGAGIKLDMYYAAFRIPDLIYNLIVMGAIASAFIPVFTSYKLKQNKNGALPKKWHLANNLFHVLTAAILLICIVMMFIAPVIINLVAPGFNPQQKTTTVNLLRIMLIQPIILAVSGIVSGILQSLKTFFAYALAPCMYNLGIIAGAIFFTPYFGIYGLAWGIVLAAVLHLLIQIPALKNANYSYKFIFDLKEKGLREVIRLAFPRSLGLASIHINIIVITAIASTVASGSISTFNYANDIQYVALGIVGIAFSTAAFPNLSENFTQKKKIKFLHNLKQAIRNILLLVIPIAFLFYSLRFQIVNVILKTGLFNLNDVWLTAACLAFFTLGIPFQSLIPLLSRTFYAFHDTLKPVLINTIGVGLNLVFSLYFIHILRQNPMLFKPVFNFFHIESLARRSIISLPAAYSLSGTINALLLFLFLKSEVRKLRLRKFLTLILKITVSGLGLFVTVRFLLSLLEPSGQPLESFLKGAIAGGSGIIVYLIGSYYFFGQKVSSIFTELKQTLTS